MTNLGPLRFTAALLLLAFLLAGTWLVQDNTAVPAVEWLMVFRLDDFQQFSDLATFMRELHTGIPPVLAAFEVSMYLLFGGIGFLTQDVFRTCFVLVFALPFLAFSRSPWHFAASYVTSFVFLWSASIITPMNQQAYDIYFPLFLLLFLVFVRFASATSRPSLAAMHGSLAGFFLAMAELARPVALFLVPILLVHAYLALRRQPRRTTMMLLLPFVLISGGWHAKIFFLHDGQIVWSNHGGDNLWRGWESVIPGEPELVTPEDPEYAEMSRQEFRGTGETSMFVRPNSDLHTHNSKIRGRVVMRYIATHPVATLRHISSEALDFLEPQVFIYRKFFTDMAPPDEVSRMFGLYHPILTVYRPLVWLSFAVLGANFMFAIYTIVRERSLTLFEKPEAAIAVTAVLLFCAFIVGEQGEEARFLVSLLPLMATYPNLMNARVVREGKRVRIQIQRYTPAGNGTPNSQADSN